MSVRQVAVAVVGCALLASGAQAATRHPRGINAREHWQTQRIRQGNQNGQLTAAEKDKLVADEAAVRAEERVYRKSGNGLNVRERRALEKDLNKTSREIYRARHNDKHPQ